MPELRDMLTPDVVVGLARFREAWSEPLTMPQAVDLALRDWLVGQGLLACSEDEDAHSMQQVHHTSGR